MSKLGSITRRSFLVGSVAIAGGVAFGYYKVKAPIPNPLLRDLGEGEAAITPYVKIDADGITLITPRADKGQGAYSFQAHLLAEELDVDPHAVNLSPGMPSNAYFNTAIMGEAFPFMATDESKLANAMRSMGPGLSKLLNMQVTGGSTTTPDSYVKLRQAGAVARETLKEAAAIRFNISRDQLKTNNGVVILPSGEQINYVELAAEAANVAPVEEVELRPKSQWRYLGKKMLRTDIVAKSTGTQDYGIDIDIENMLYATVRTNPALGGKVHSFDANQAKHMRGVHKIVEITNGIGVIADNTWRAFKAANSIEIKWDSASYPANTDAMYEKLTNSISDENATGPVRQEGNVDTALAQADKVFEAEYRTPNLAHAPLEPLNATVLVDKNRIDIWTGTQIPGFVQQHAAKLSGYDVENIFVHAQPMGGSFGRRLESDYVMQALEVALAVPNRAVKMTWTREEDMAHNIPRPAQIARGKGSVKNGRIETFDLAVVGESVGASWLGRLNGLATAGPDPSLIAGAWDQPFAIPNYRVTPYKASLGLPIGNWRSVAASGNGFLHASFFDELANEAGADPLEEMLRLCTHEVSRKVLEEVGELCNWKGTDIGKARGRGIAFTLSFGAPTAVVVDVTDTVNGIQIDDAYVAIDVGKVLDPINFEAQMMGGVVFALAHAMNCEITYQDFNTQQTNFHMYPGIRFNQTPNVHIKGLENNSHVTGVGEPSVPPTGPALANAIYAATGKRIRQLPLNKEVTFA